MYSWDSVLLAALIGGATLALSFRRFGWVGFGTTGLVCLGLALAQGDHWARTLPVITTPPQLNWQCHATPLLLTAAATVLSQAALTRLLAPRRWHWAIHLASAAATTVAAILFFAVTVGVLWTVTYLGCDTM